MIIKLNRNNTQIHMELYLKLKKKIINFGLLVENECIL